MLIFFYCEFQKELFENVKSLQLRHDEEIGELADRFQVKPEHYILIETSKVVFSIDYIYFYNRML